jgi:formylglycine-generating enzyme required for sulfatase activity
MKQFNQQILAAKSKQRRLYLAVFGLFLMGALIILSLILASRGTRIDIQPDEAASQSVIHLDSGIALIIADTLYSISKHPSITVAADGFQTLTQQLNSNDFGNIMSITLLPLPAHLMLTSNIDNQQTQWQINGDTLAMSAEFDYELEAGDYDLNVSHPFYADVNMPLSLKRGEIFKDQVQLNLIDGSLAINTTPKEAQISVNTVDMGESPQNMALKGGRHNIKIVRSGYESINDTVEITNDNPTVNRDYRLALRKAAVELSLNPEDGQLYLDNIAIKSGKKIKVKAGVKHKLSYSKPGYFSQNKTFTLAADDTFKIDFALKKEMGDVDIQSSPNAEVEVDGKPVGTTPLNLSLNAIEQHITLKKQGYRSVTKIITPSSKHNKKINISLASEKTARLNEAIKIYTNIIGSQLKLFRPNDSFTMGASRSEPGQRANEFIKQVKLTKPFYAGIAEISVAEYSQYDKNTQGDKNKPVTNISWLEAAQFCNWLSQKEGLTPVYQIKNNQLMGINKSDGYRLLTEAEWEWLARKSGKKQQSTFVWGDDLVIPKNATNIADESANGHVDILVSKYNDNYPNAAPVKSFAQETSGLYDQAGNVSEWTHDSYSIAPPKSGKVFIDPFDLSRTSSRVVKGANWRSGSITELRPSFREGLTTSRDDLGFRIARYVYGGN